MKRLFTACGILVMLVLLAWLHVSQLQKLTDDLTGQLTRMEEDIRRGDLPAAQRIAEDVSDRWERQGLFLHTTLHHAEIDAIATTLDEIRAYLSIGEDQGECLALTARLITQLELLLEDELPTWENLL